MNPLVKLMLYFMGAVALSVAIAPILIKLLSRFKAKQTVLDYVAWHESKSGTPTMGGLIFILPCVVFSLIELGAFSGVAIALSVSFGVLGFLDDFIKIRMKRNLGLKAYQKIVGQVGLALIAGYFSVKSQFVGSSINLPFSEFSLDLGWGIIVFVAFVFIACSNAVNLTDGVDGLAGMSSVAYFVGFNIILVILFMRANDNGDTIYAQELFGLLTFSISLTGGLVGYLVFNSNPSKVMMGDTGSLFLGSAVAVVAVFSKNPILILFSGIMFVFTVISVILQVIYFKATKKRIFLMSPFHHHLEMKGHSEARIVSIYFAVTLLFSALSVIGVLV